MNSSFKLDQKYLLVYSFEQLWWGWEEFYLFKKVLSWEHVDKNWDLDKNMFLKEDWRQKEENEDIVIYSSSDTSRKKPLHPLFKHTTR